MKAKDYSTTLSNLCNLIDRFKSGERLSAKQISNEYSVSIRTAQRYINFIKDAGFNLLKENKSYYLKRNIDSKEIVFEAIESLAKNAGIEKEILPLLKELKNTAEENVFYSKLDIEKIDTATFSKIEYAISNNLIIEMKYKMDNKIKDMKIKPLKISNFDGYWYVNALNHKDEYRTYHIRSIKQLKVTNEKFTPNRELLKNLDKAVNIWFDPQKEFISVELFADEYATKYLKRIPISKTQKICENNDKTSTIYLEITNSNEIIRKLLMWIPNLKVLSPKWLKEEVDNMIKEYLLDYLEKE
jgi:predicted DNA-binding transcriptional regulator YafY